MTALDRATAAQRREALRIERASQRALTESYKAILARLQADLDALTTRIAAAQAAGETVNANWLSREERARALMAQTEAEIGRYSVQAERVIANGQRAAALAALETSDAVMVAALGTPPPGVSVAFNRLPVGAIEELVGNLGDGRPLSGVLDKLGKLQSQAVRQALIQGIGAGEGPRAIARRVREQFIARDGTVRGAGYHALRLSRNEVNRAYRDSTLANYRAQGGLVTSYRVICAGGTRTCGMCYAMSGQVFPLDRPFASHVCCRCCVVAVTRALEGYQEPPIPDDGPTVFARLTEEQQRQILGAGKYEMYANGDGWDWADLITETRSAIWGRGRRETPLYQLQREQTVAAD
jgi:SPP1 gp7 family putative phage head morphogenesis protein